MKFSGLPLAAKFLLLLLPPLVLSFVLGVAGTAYVGYRNQKDVQHSQNASIMEMYAHSLVNPLWDCDRQTAQGIMRILQHMPGVARIKLTDDCSSKELRWQAPAPRTNGRETYYLAHDIVYVDEFNRPYTVGRLEVWFLEASMIQAMADQAWHYGAILVLLLSAMLLAAVLANLALVTAPLSRFKAAIAAQRSGNAMDLEELKGRKDELGEVMRAHAQLMQEQQRRDERKDALAECARMLLRSRADDTSVLNDVLDMLLGAVDVDRAYIFKNEHNAAGELCMSPTHERCAPGVEFEMDNPVLQQLPYASGYSRWGKLFAAGDLVSGGVDLLPVGNQAEAEGQSVASCTAHPIWIGDHWHGFIGLDDIQRDRVWTEDEIVFLQTAADMIGAYLLRVASKERLQQERRQFLSLLDGIPEMIYVADKDNHEILFANKALKDNFGQDATGRKCHEVMQQRQTSCEFCTNPIIFSQREPHFWQFQHPVTSRHYYMIDQAITWTDGRDVRFELAIDITRLKETEQALKESEAKYRLIAENILDVIWVLNVGQDRFTYVSPSVENLRGYTAEEVMSRHWSEALLPEFAETVRASLADRIEAFEKAPHAPNVRMAQHQQPCKDGSLVWVESATKLQRGADGDIEVLGVTRNIEERIKHERLKEDVERIMRHDLKAPLNAVICLPQLIEAEGQLNKEQLELLRHISQQGHQMLQMINFSLDLYKLEAGVYAYAPVSVDLLTVLREVIFNAQLRFQSLGVEVLLSQDGQPLPPIVSLFIPGERMLLYSLFSNLVLNAMEASPRGGTVSVDIRLNEFCRVTVHNQGVVPPAIQERFFEKFATHGKTGGTGLGTYSARLMTEVMGGAIRLQTSADHGTSITVELPR